MGRTIASANPYTFVPQAGEVDPWAASRPGLTAQQAIIARDNRMPNLVKKVATTAVGTLLGANVIGAFAGGAGATGAGSVNGLPITPYAGSVTASGTGAATGGSGMGFSLGKIFGSRGFEAGANVVGSLFGQRSQNKANKYATDTNARLLADQAQREEARIAREEEADRLDRIDIERRWQAEQEQEKLDYAADQEQREYNRSISERNVRLDDEREARRAVYRPYSEAAMRSLGSILRIK